MYIKRDAENDLEDILRGNKVGIVLGARQVGKTTLVRHVLADRNALFLNFDIDVERRRFLAAAAMSPEDALGSLGAPEVLVLDEVQRVPEAPRIVKGWHDARLPVRILLLGSSSLDLLDSAAEPLTGRNEKLRLSPLSFGEIVRSRTWFPGTSAADALSHFGEPLRALLLRAMAFGGYPEAVTTDDPPALLRNLASDYLWKDVLQAGLVRNPPVIRRLLLLLAHQAGSEVSVLELATQLGMARPTVERHLDLLEQTFVIFRLPAFSTNPRKEIAKSRKVFFWDTGIRNALLDAFSADELRPDIGALWENWAIAEVAKRNLLSGGAAELFFWRSRSRSEVDLVVRRGGRLRAFEIKWRPERRIVGRAFRELYGVEVERLDSSNPMVDRTVFPE